MVNAAIRNLDYVGAVRVTSVWYLRTNGRTLDRVVGGQPGPAKDKPVVLMIMTGQFSFSPPRTGGPPWRGRVAVVVLGPHLFGFGIVEIHQEPLDISGVPGANCIPLADVGWAIHG